jgi:hypothetical protein
MYRLSHPMERSIGDIAEGDQIQPIDLHCPTWNFNKKIGKIFGICVATTQRRQIESCLNVIEHASDAS